MKILTTRLTTVSTVFISFGAILVAGLSAKEMSALKHFLESIETVGTTETGPTKEEITHDLAVGLGLKNSAGLLYKYSPDAKIAYSTMYDSLLFLSVSGVSDLVQKKQLAKVIKYFEISLID
ncbi:hypothetical protein BX661DRAFT_185054 [Kickxella alabastrina]|uniref:uncharacterized protein n=1 Tax=Kickxella alabastrina TaxID=61397 RepID=UPI002220116F|nr:uncharacterized protein BX661DRAFT_185054 [Kickxella alabastrina]KAI7824981.1 hypothetical protein BX661DRAFT_185054 [Kickxella alabastrina]KAJ1934598.1 hypothetical protein GGF37_006305 [Kickxella alabastrina]